MTDSRLHDAWDELHAATPPGWFVGRPGQRHGGQWAMYAFDQTEKAHVGRRSREWTAVCQTEEECLRAPVPGWKTGTGEVLIKVRFYGLVSLESAPRAATGR